MHAECAWTSDVRVQTIRCAPREARTVVRATVSLSAWYGCRVRLVAILLMAVLACGPKADGAEGESTNVSGSGEAETADTSSSSSSGGTWSGGSSPIETSTSTSSATTDEVQMDVFEPDPVVGECIRENDLEGSVEIDTPVGGFAIASAFWGWNWCCGPYPVVVLAEDDVLVVDDWILPGLPSDQPAFLAMIDPEGLPPWTGDAPSRFSAQRGPEHESTEWTRITTLVDVLEDPELGGEPPPLELAFADEGEGWRVEGSIVAEYCPALEYPICPCE